ncbi:MAG TPA: protoglobin domain-containing protein [Anaeromyxobacteraceae bacterium]|nr:protoglobin domain-containing protein [Anaeromyxobacteraceae bacterium]
MAENVFEELKRYVGWGPEDERALRDLHAVAAPSFGAIANIFYDRILAHDGARRALGGESQVGHLKITLALWLDQLLSGPWDQEYFLARCRIGRVHVRIDLPQHYMFGAMNVVRRELNQLVDRHYLERPEALASARRAVGRILDLELAVMLETYREDLLARQARAERLATYAQLVGSIGHELRNPLGVIETSLFLLRQRDADGRSAKHLDRIADQLALSKGIVDGLLDLIRERPLSRSPVRLAEVVAGAAGAVFFPPQVRFSAEGLEGLPAVEGDPLQLRQVLVNLIENAVHAASPSGEVRVAASRGEGAVELAVEDSGPGVDPATARRLFEPLITTKASGVGLGLALVKRIAERHGGSVRYEPRPGGGARFLLRLPW